MVLRFAVLGPLLAWRDAEPVDSGHVKQQALLVALLLRPDVTVSQQELLDGVWGTEPPATGRDVVANYVHRLRRRFEPRIITTEQSGYRFTGRQAWVDTAYLQDLASQAVAARDCGDHDTALRMLVEASELFRGEPLAGLPGPFAQSERLRLLEYRNTLWQEQAECRIRLGRCGEAVGGLTGLAESQPLNEVFAGFLMRALYGSGRQADALDVYVRMRSRLVDELGVEPGEELRRIQQAVPQRDDVVLLGGEYGVAAAPAGGRPDAARRRETAGFTPRNGLPAAVGAFAGRAHELAQIRAVATERAEPVAVVAIDGMAGAGKTALAVRAARSLADRYPDGCLFLDLYGHRAEREPLSPERAVRRLLRSVGADDSVSAADSADTDDADRFDDLVGSWRNATSGRRLLLILDDAVRAEHIRPLIPAGEGSLVIATSRRRLPGLDADARFSLGPLGEEDAVGLLTRIVGGVLADREDAEAAREVARLCGGLPLALKIVGARLQSRQSWDLRNLAARLVDDEVRLVELTAEDRSVEAAFRLSFDQLPHTEQLAFVALGACPAVRLDGLTLSSMLGCSPEDAEQALVNLVDASLVEQVSAESYQAHELVAAYARRLASADPERARTAGRVSGP